MANFANTGPVLESPSVLGEIDFDLDKLVPLRFYPDLLGRFKAYAIGCVCMAAVLLVLVFLFDLHPMLLLLMAPFLFMAYKFMQKAYDRKPLLTVYPEKGLASAQWLSGVGWSLLDDVRFREKALGSTAVELVFRPGMPWPGLRGNKAEPPDHPERGRVLLVDLSTMSPSMQKQMYQAIIKHYMAYRIKRGWGISPSML